eukprot:SAG31_NODE_3576_length_4107_cov_4.203593_7_plen_92_part_00
MGIDVKTREEELAELEAVAKVAKKAAEDAANAAEDAAKVADEAAAAAKVRSPWISIYPSCGGIALAPDQSHSFGALKATRPKLAQHHNLSP